MSSTSSPVAEAVSQPESQSDTESSPDASISQPTEPQEVSVSGAESSLSSISPGMRAADIIFRQLSGARRNVPKLIIRAVLKMYRRSKEMAPLYRAAGISEEILEAVAANMEQLKARERIRECGGMSKDYTKLLDSMMNSGIITRILQCCLRRWLERRIEAYGKAEWKNMPESQRVNVQTVEDYLIYIEAKLGTANKYVLRK